jgi:hypothetical protein
VRVSVLPTALDSELMGSRGSPKVSVQASGNIAVKGREGWGAMVVSSPGLGPGRGGGPGGRAGGRTDWQLFVLTGEDIRNAGNLGWNWGWNWNWDQVEARTAGGLAVSTTPAFTADRMEMYANFISGICPSYIAVKENKISFRDL